MSPVDESSPEHFLASAPDLVVEETAGGWQVLRLSASLARLAGLGAEEAQGRRVDRLFPETVPSLEELAREARERQETLTAIRVGFPGPRGQTILLAEVRPGGLTADFRHQVVHFAFRQPTAREAETAVSFAGMIGTGPGIREVFRKIERYADSDAPVVITGETGTGKELVARALHQGSSRSEGPFVAVNCSAISDELLESELFGHEKGAFTGAVRTHRGRFERAHRGSLFLDEIGDMPRHTQAKLLRVLEEGRIERVGGEQEKPVDVRVLCATNVPLERAVSEGRFRSDLYHRVAVLRIHVPPLRQRLEDLPLLVEYFLKIFRRKYNRHIERLTPEALNLLQSYLWPGNVRELRNVLERVFVETQAEVIGARAFREWIRERRDFSPGDWGPDTGAGRSAPLIPPHPLPSEHPLLAAPRDQVLEAELVPTRERNRPSTVPAGLDAGQIRKAYRAAGGNLAAAARLLGVHRATLYRYLDKLGLSREELES